MACLAVGSYSTGAALENNHGLVETWNGGTWSIRPAADSTSELASVACVPRQSCTAVGRTVMTGSVAAQWQAFVEVLALNA